jgi:hypothetical protein
LAIIETSSSSAINPDGINFPLLVKTA